MWGCVFKKVMDKDPQLKRQLLAHPLVTKRRIDARDALKGGRFILVFLSCVFLLIFAHRTNAARLYYTAPPGMRLRYLDFTSLWVLK
jgi:hypothetical protein